MTQAEQAAVLADPGERRGGTGTARFVLGKIVEAIVSLLLVIVLFFFLFRLLPGDPISAMRKTDRALSPQQVAALRAELHLDDSVLVQFGRYLWDLLHGNLGTSTLLSPPAARSRT